MCDTIIASTDVDLSEDHHETIAAGQHLQHGPELEPIDRSFVGKDVVINKSTGVIDNSRGTTPGGKKVTPAQPSTSSS
jgi:hypothetical protein